MPEIHLDDTIAAIATPLGEGGISIIRLSGPEAFEILEKIFRPKSGKLSAFPSHTIHYGQIFEQEKAVDQVLVSLFRAPNSYTGQDVIEISSHGGLIITKHILSLLIANGARHAEPGEFTKRAFLNGKMDLTQAEAVLDLIRAKSEKSLEVAVRQLGGSLSHKFKALKEELMKMLAHMEAFLDFPDEHLEVYEDKVFLKKFESIEKEIQELAAGFKRGALLREGALVVIVGRPNVGKSSLFNALLARDRALVSEFPGTTRDALEEAIEIGGVYLRLVDTAGLSAAPERENPVDLMGMERTRKTLQEADCFLYMVDGSVPLDAADHLAYQEIINAVPGTVGALRDHFRYGTGLRRDLSRPEMVPDKPILVLINKSDLPRQLQTETLQKIIAGLPVISISSKTKQGLDILEKKLSEIFSAAEIGSEQITRLRHKHALEEALQSLREAKEAFVKQESLEFVTADLKHALDSLRELVGEIYSEDLLDVIFSEFCIGK